MIPGRPASAVRGQRRSRDGGHADGIVEPEVGASTVDLGVQRLERCKIYTEAQRNLLACIARHDVVKQTAAVNRARLGGNAGRRRGVV